MASCNSTRRQIGVDSHVTFHGFLPQESVLEILTRADLYVQSSLHEAAGVSVLEAAAAGVPVVGTAADTSPSGRRRKRWPSAMRSPGSLADAILTLHADPDRRRSMATLAQTFSIAHDSNWAAAQINKLYRSVIGV